MKTEELMSILSDQRVSLDDVLSNLKTQTLASYLNDLLDEKGLTRAQVINASGLSRDYANQIFNGKRSNPSQIKILALAIAMGLTLEQTNRVLKLAGASTLYPKLPFDATIIFAIVHKMNVMQTNALLDEHDLTILE